MPSQSINPSPNFYPLNDAYALYPFYWNRLVIIQLSMGPKKKVQDDDDSTEKLLRIYRKKCE